METAHDSRIERLEITSQEFFGRWQRLVSTTNWEKGRIISEWRAALLAAGAPLAEYSDEAWSRLVGGVSGQHAGRLRRAWDRFGATAANYAGLFWSHFQAALDWPDAEMWLEGAVQSGWSVGQMRAQRWEAIGAPADLKPRPEDVITAELDEDYLDGNDPSGDFASEVALVHAPAEQDEAGEEAHRAARESEEYESETSRLTAAAELDEGFSPTQSAVRPFENLPELPDDLADAFESFKLAILRHKQSGWNEVSAGDIVHALDALKVLALAPSGD